MRVVPKLVGQLGQPQNLHPRFKSGRRLQPSLTLANPRVSYGWRAKLRAKVVHRSSEGAKVDLPPNLEARVNVDRLACDERRHSVSGGQPNDDENRVVLFA